MLLPACYSSTIATSGLRELHEWLQLTYGTRTVAGVQGLYYSTFSPYFADIIVHAIPPFCTHIQEKLCCKFLYVFMLCIVDGLHGW